MGKEQLYSIKNCTKNNLLPDLTKYSIDQLIYARDQLMNIRGHLKRDPDTELPRDGQAQLRECLDAQIYAITKILSG